MGTAEESVFQAEGTASAETGPSLGFREVEGGVRRAAVCGAQKPGRRVQVSLTACGESSGSLGMVGFEFLIQSLSSGLDDEMHCVFLDRVLARKGHQRKNWRNPNGVYDSAS